MPPFLGPLMSSASEPPSGEAVPREPSIPDVITSVTDSPAPTTARARFDRDRSLLRGVAWNGIVKLVGQSAAWASTIVVARHLLPDDYGVVGMATFMLGLIELVTEFGIGTAIATRKDLTDEQAMELNSVSVLLGVAGTLVICATAPLVSRFFHDGRVVKVLFVLSSTFLLRSFRSVPWGLLQRDLRFRSLAVYDGVQSLVLATFSVILAVMGLGYWTLVAASVASALITSLLAVVRHPVAFRRPRLEHLRPLLSFSGYIVGQRASWFAYSNADFVVAGRMLGSGLLGTYTLAWTLSHITDKVTALVLQVTPPVLAKVQDDLGELRRLVIRITEAMALSILPLMFGLALVAHDFVPVVLGAKWTSMVFPLQVLSAYAAVNVVVPLLAQVLIVTGHARYGMRHNFLQLAVMPCAFVVGAHFGGLNGIVIAWIAIHPFLALRISRHTLRTIELPAAIYIRESLAPSLLGCLLMTVAVVLVRAAWGATPPTLSRLVTEIAGGAVVYAGALFLLYRSRLVGIAAFIRQLRQS